MLDLIFQLIKRQFGIAGRVTGAAAVGATVQAAAIVSLELARHIRDKLPVQVRQDYLELEAWLTDGDDDVLTVNRSQLRDFITRGAFGTVEREYVHSACLRLFTKRFARNCMSWAGAKGNKEFTLKTSKVWELLNDVINAKFPNFQKNMAVHFNNFYKDVGKEATRASGPRGGADDARRGCGRRQRSDDEDKSVLTAEPRGGDANPEHLLECGVEEGQEPQTPVSHELQSQDL